MLDGTLACVNVANIIYILACIRVAHIITTVLNIAMQTLEVAPISIECWKHTTRRLHPFRCKCWKHTTERLHPFHIKCWKHTTQRLHPFHSNVRNIQLKACTHFNSNAGTYKSKVHKAAHKATQVMHSLNANRANMSYWPRALADQSNGYRFIDQSSHWHA